MHFGFPAARRLQHPGFYARPFLPRPLLFHSLFFLSNVTTNIGPFADKPEFWEAGYEYVVQQLKLEFSAADRRRVDGDVRAAVRRFITNVNSHIRNGRYSEEASRLRLQQAA